VAEQRDSQQFTDQPIITDGLPSSYADMDPVETQEWLESFSAVVGQEGRERGRFLLLKMIEQARRANIGIPSLTTTDYVNTIAVEREQPFPGDAELERRIRSFVRWNAAVMVHRATLTHGVGGHISTYASIAHLFEVGFNHFFRGKDHPGGGDQIFFQGHASPGIYARSFLEGRISEAEMDAFRREVEPGGLSSYPHPRLMPEYWEFPTVSMGLGPLGAIYQARFNRYLHNRGIKDTSDQTVWFFGGDGETAEPESLGALAIAARENLDNLVFVINCNLQQLDGPVRGNGKIIQELEGVFRGNGWNVIKVVWGCNWDPILEKDVDGALVNRMNEVPDGQFQTYIAKDGAYTRKDFFDADPKVAKLVEHLTDEEIPKLRRGGHDIHKIYAAYDAAMKNTGTPTVILAHTVKGWTLGPDFEARNAVHQMKKLSVDSLKTFRDNIGLDIPDAELEGDLPPYITFDEGSPELNYLHERRAALGGPVPERRVDYRPLNLPEPSAYGTLKKGSGEQELATTMALVRLFKDLLRNKDVGNRLVPIIPDEARTFGMDSLFPKLKIYDPHGQQYESVDQDLLLSYKSAVDGVIINEGITEAGAMGTFTAAGSSYSTHGEVTIPLYFFYSMFGFQRTADSIWAAADQRARGFLIGATAGGTTLNGEGLQHQDRHSHLIAMSNPGVVAYDPSFAYEIAVIVEAGLERMYGAQSQQDSNGEYPGDSPDVMYYLTVYNEPRVQPPMPEHVKNHEIIEGMYRYLDATSGTHEAHILSSGTIIHEAVRAQQMLADEWDVAATVWSCPGWNELLRNGGACDHHNRLHPDEEPRVPTVTQRLAGTSGPYVAVTDWMKATPTQIADWVPGEYAVLGTDGFGRSDTRAKLRRLHQIDAESTVVTVLSMLVKQGTLDSTVVKEAIDKYGIDPDKRADLD
jgi:pyruvate dehydrogenase E1 component